MKDIIIGICLLWLMPWSFWVSKILLDNLRGEVNEENRNK